MRLQDLPQSYSNQNGVISAKNRELDQWDRMEPRNRPPYSQLIFNKGAKAEQWNKTATSGAGATGHPHVKKKNLDTDFTPLTEINPKWITDLNVKCKTITAPRRKLKRPCIWWYLLDNAKDTIHEWDYCPHEGLYKNVHCDFIQNY